MSKPTKPFSSRAVIVMSERQTISKHVACGDDRFFKEKGKGDGGLACLTLSTLGR